MKIPFNNHYTKLGKKFYAEVAPEPVADPSLIKFNAELAKQLGIIVSGKDEKRLATTFSANAIPTGAVPLAMAYAGHQFGNFVPQLGDGRALLFGELYASGIQYSLHLKGTGRTPFSRNGDGRAALGPILREYLLSEAMHKLNVPTTRALAAVSTGENVLRERPLPSAIITRVAKSFVRIGTFEYFRAKGDANAIRQLADHVIQHHYPELMKTENPFIHFFSALIERQATLIAHWMSIGFIHGVMNTDNMSIVGETIDYGPCAFMDHYAQNKVFSSIDYAGRYAYSNQPAIGMWNLIRLAECLLPLFANDQNQAIKITEETLQTYQTIYENHWLKRMRAKCGLSAIKGTAQEDKKLVEKLLHLMHKNQTDFTLFFSYLSYLTHQPSLQDEACKKLFNNSPQFDQWLTLWRKRLKQESEDDAERQCKMCAVNPTYIPRNHQIEAAIRAAEDNGDFSLFHTLHQILQKPYEKQTGKAHYQMPPEPHEKVQQTFCGT